jgi:hypothetical protein
LDDIKCDIRFVHPALDKALAAGDIDIEQYKTHAPSFTIQNVPLNV